MIRIENEAWDTMVAHAQSTYPNECCGAILGVTDNGATTAQAAVELENAFAGEQRQRYEIRLEDLQKADAEARNRGLELIGIFHSHPDEDAYFSETDLKNSCAWYSFVVLSVRNGVFDHAKCFRPDLEQTSAEEEALEYPNRHGGRPSHKKDEERN